jgi:hypothetical protein
MLCLIAILSTSLKSGDVPTGEKTPLKVITEGH